MAYDRAPRVDLAGRSQTGPGVAPNSYQPTYDELCTCKGSNWAPFLVSSERKAGGPTSVTPAPNAYYPKIKRKIPGGASMLYTEQRFPRGRKKFDVSGQKVYKSHRGSLKDRSPPRVKGYLYHCNTPYTILGYCPSIPRSWHKGYDNLSNGTLVECCYPENDTALAPTYNLNYNTFGMCYRGPYWSKYSRRKSDPKSDIPGVGSYDIEPKPNDFDDYILRLRNERKKTANLPRYIDKIQCDAMRNNYPAPNQYDTYKPKQWKGVKKKLVPKRVIKEQKWSQRVKDTGPGPSDYMDPRTAFWYLKKPSCVKELNAFLSNAPRFKRARVYPTPAPNNYKLKGFVDEIKGKVSPYAVRKKVAFDTSVPKKVLYLLPEYLAASQNDACESLSPPDEPEVFPQHPTWPFASKTKRFKTFQEIGEVSPASYNITESYKLMTNQRSFRKAKYYNFLVGEKRFAKNTNFNQVDDKSNVPFLKYNVQLDCIGKTCSRIFKRPTFTQENRFTEHIDQLPGPLDYSVPRCPSLQTFNVSLNPPKLTPYQLYKMKLRWKPFNADNAKKTRVEEEKPKSVAKVEIVGNFPNIGFGTVCMFDQSKEPCEYKKSDSESESDSTFDLRLSSIRPRSGLARDSETSDISENNNFFKSPARLR